MISNIRDNLSNVNFLQYNGDRQANGNPKKLPESNLSQNGSLRNFASFQAKNRNATEVNISKAGLEAFKQMSKSATDETIFSNTDKHEQNIIDIREEFERRAQESKKIGIRANEKMQATIADGEKNAKLMDIKTQMMFLSMPEESGELDEINIQIKMQESFLKRRPQMEAQLEELRNTEPVAAKLLNKQEVKAAFALAAMLGKRVGGAGDFTYSFSHENTSYTFTREGEVLTNEINVPTSAADKASKIEGLQRIMSYGDPSPELAARRDTLMAEKSVRDEAKQVKMAELVAQRDVLLAA